MATRLVAPRVARRVGLKDSKRDAPRDMEAAWITGSPMGDVPSYQSSPSGVKFSCRSNTMPPTSLQAGGAIFGTRASHRERPRTQNDDAGLLGVYGGMNENFVLVAGRSRWESDGV